MTPTDRMASSSSSSEVVVPDATPTTNEALQALPTAVLDRVRAECEREQQQVYSSLSSE